MNRLNNLLNAEIELAYTTEVVLRYYKEVKNNPLFSKTLIEREDWDSDEWTCNNLKYGDRVTTCIIQGDDLDNLGLNVWIDRNERKIAYAFHDFEKGLVEVYLIKER